MNGSTRSAGGRIGIAAVVILLLLAVVLYFYSERAAPPEPEPSVPARPAPEPEPGGAGEATAVPTDTAPPRPVPAAPRAPERSPPTEIRAAEPEPSLEESAARLRVAIAERLKPDQLPLLASDRLLERIVATVHSLDGDPVPLRFRPLAHVPDLPRVEPAGKHWRLPSAPDPRYRPYRALFDRFDAETLAALFARHEDALQLAWVRLGESREATFRWRLIEVLRHVAEYDLPARRPSLHRPEVLYEYVDPALERLSWGRKLLIRIGPAHAPAVQRKAAALADRLANRPDAVRR